MSSRRRGSSSISTVGIVFITTAVLCSGYLGLLAISRGSSLSASGDGSSNLGLSRPNRVLRGGSDTSQCPACPVCEKPDPRPQVLTTAHYLHNSRRFHTITTTAGFGNHWQVRIHYYWFKRQKEACEKQPSCDMGGFTRLLHTGAADDLMDEVPTVVVDPLPKSAFGGQDSSYIVLNRPWAFVEWLSKASVPERYILMCESDHLLMRPLPNMMRGEAQAAAHFSYMNPDQYPAIIRSLVGNVPDSEIKLVPRIGNSPTYISIKDFRKLAPVWYNTTMDIWKDKAAHDAWNWVLEMYGYAVGSYRAGVHKDLYHSENLLAHPPFDATEMHPVNGEPFYIIHLTYPMRYNATGQMVDDDKKATWVFDKRRYGDKPPPRNLPEPPPYVKNELVSLAVKMVNEATENIPCWDDYVATKKVRTECAPAASTLTHANTA